MSEDSRELKKLTQSFYSDLKHLMSQDNEINCSPLSEYFDHMTNSFDYDDHIKLEEQKAACMKVNDKLAEMKRLQHKSFDINWNVTYCDQCRLSYWPHNCTPYMTHKYHLSNRLAKLNSRADTTLRQGSFVNKLATRLIKRGFKLVYSCKRCGSRNVMIDELKRDQIKFVNKDRLKASGAAALAKFLSSSHNKSREESAPSVLKKPNTNDRRRFQSLKMKLKQNDWEQEKMAREKEKSASSLASFLQNLT